MSYASIFFPQRVFFSARTLFHANESHTTVTNSKQVKEKAMGMYKAGLSYDTACSVLQSINRKYGTTANLPRDAVKFHISAMRNGDKTTIGPALHKPSIIHPSVFHKP